MERHDGTTTEAPRHAATGRSALRPARCGGRPARRRGRRAGLRLGHWLRRDERGGVAAELAILFPVFVGLFVAAFELGLFMTRQVMLDRAADVTVRALRLGQIADPDLNKLRTSICDQAGVILPNCQQSILIELTQVPLQGWTPPSISTECVERDEEGALKPVANYLVDAGTPNDMMLIRICSLQKPEFPTTYLGLAMRNHGDYYALMTNSAFVVEPKS